MTALVILLATVAVVEAVVIAVVERRRRRDIAVMREMVEIALRHAVPGGAT